VETLRHACTGAASDVAAVARACAPHQAHAAERRLLERLDEALARLDALPAADRAEVRAVLATLTTGMLFDLARFPGEDAASLAALDTLDELNRYMYLVAGCVGPLWTALHAAHRARSPRCRVSLHARDPAARVADAARVRVAPPDRPRDPRRARRSPGSARCHGADQDSSSDRARAAHSLGAHRLVRHRARRRRRAPPAENHALISLLRSSSADGRVGPAPANCCRTGRRRWNERSVSPSPGCPHLPRPRP